MKNVSAIILLLIGFTALNANVILSGYLNDESNGEALIGATVYVDELKQGVVSNPYGFYSLSVPPGKYTITFSYIGYGSRSVEMNLSANTKFSVRLAESTRELEEVVVTGEKSNRNVESLDVSKEKVPVKMAQKLPSFMGEVDVIKTIQLLPGIQSGGEGSSGLYVRGGGPDENLIILDEAPVYNASHLMGFFSVFNADAIKDIEVYKGGIPARYGGKASSVIDIHMKDGNMNHCEFAGGIGNVSSRLTAQGPIIKNKWSYLVSGRRTYADVLFRPFVEALKDNRLYFYDLNAKSNIILSDKDRIYLSAYTGDDAFALGDALYMRWGNLTSTARWNHVFGQKLFSNTSLIYSKYDYNMGVPGNGSDQFDWNSQIRDYNLKQDFNWFATPNNTVNFGFNIIDHHFEPGRIETKSNSMFNDLSLTNYNALENALYVSNEQILGPRFSVQYGIRYSLFQQIGEGKVRNYRDPENPVITDTLNVVDYRQGELVGSAFHNLEPRLSMKYSLGTSSSIKASYNRMVQNLHLISNTNSPTPLDIWLPSSKYIDPLIVDQYVLGYFRNFKNDAIETSVEVYYKDMQNVLDYKNGAELFLRENIETELVTGTGYSYGTEWLIKKQQGSFTGWIGYTYSRTMREVKEISDDPYPSSYDRTHDLSVVMNYELSKRWNFSGTWVYSTGSPYTLPAAKYEAQGMQHYYYSERNSYRLPDYHRLDLSFTYNFKKNDYRKYKQSLNLSVYNVYGRRNAYSITFRPKEGSNGLESEAVRLSIIGAPIVAVTYNFNFNCND